MLGMVTSNTKRQQWLFADVGIAMALVAWWLYAQDVADFVLPDPLEVFLAGGMLVWDKETLAHVLVSVARVFVSVFVSVVVALVLTYLMRLSTSILVLIERNLLVLLNSFPSVGWAILGVTWFSVSPGTVVFIEIMIVLPFCLINTLQGYRSMDKEVIEMASSFSRNPWRRFLKIELPLMAPFLVAGARIGYGIAWKIALVAELFGAQSGLGWLLQQAQSRADAASVLATCLIIVLLFSLGDSLLLKPLARRFSTNQQQI